MITLPEVLAHPASSDDSVLARLHTAFADDLLRMCRSLCAEYGLWDGEAEDLSQKTWAKIAQLLAHKPRTNCPNEIRKWLKTVARRLLLDTLQRRARRKARERAREARESSYDPPIEEPDESYRDVLNDALKRHCTAEMRQALRLRSEGAPWDEIAEQLGVSRSTAIRLWNKAIQVLRSVMGVRADSVP